MFGWFEGREDWAPPEVRQVFYAIRMEAVWPAGLCLMLCACAVEALHSAYSIWDLGDHNVCEE